MGTLSNHLVLYNNPLYELQALGVLRSTVKGVNDMEDTAIPWYARKSTRETIGKNIVYIVLVALSLVVSMPFFWIISSSLKSEAEIFLFPPKWIPSRFLWRNYPEALTSFAFGRALKNTITITGTVIVGRLFSTSLAAFAFARLRFPLRNTLFMLVISTMMLHIRLH